MKQPPEELRRQVIEWIAAVRINEIRKHSGDPGPVAARRLSNAEYNYTIRDLTGVDLRPAREFPVDPANQAGFDNSGESLTISSALISKYLDAARRVTEAIHRRLHQRAAGRPRSGCSGGPAEPIRSSVCPLQPRVSHGFLFARARSVLPHHFDGQGALSGRGTAQRAGLFPRRHSARRTDPR
jgi:hypothetical protein